MAEMDLEQAKRALKGTIPQAEAVLNNPSEVDLLLAEIQEKTKDLPATVGSALTNIPTMAAMVKSYVTREYTEVSPKVVASVVGAMLYLVKGKDIIPDSIPIVGLLDDVAVVTVAMKLCEPELEAFKQWRKTGSAKTESSVDDILDVFPDVQA